MTDAPTALERFREDLGLSPIELWWRYFALGGNLTPLEIRALLAGALVGTPARDVRRPLAGAARSDRR